MFPPVNTQDPEAVQQAVTAAYATLFGGEDVDMVARIFACVTRCFRGGCPHYAPIDARYHDLEHTLQGTLCMARLLEGRHRAGVQPVLNREAFERGLLAILLHDTGYARRRDDVQGTGAKYTFTHVARSAQFAAELLADKGFSAAEIQSVQNMIRCTGVNVDLAAIPFQNDVERLVGYALGTADLLGQMAAADYVDKLPFLYAEFAEATAFCGGSAPPGATFKSLDDLIRGTPAFWEKYVRVKIDRDFGGLYRFLEDPYPGGPNEYLQKIEANIARIRRQLAEQESPQN